MDRLFWFFHWLALAAAVWCTGSVVRRSLGYYLVTSNKLEMALLAVRGRVPVLRVRGPLIVGGIAWMWFFMM